MLKHIMWLVVLMALLMACESLVGSSAPGICFPQLKTSSGMSMNALLEGRLAVKKGCLRVLGRNGESGHLVLWQPGYVLINREGVVEILNQRGEVVARAGEEIRMGGGVVVLTEELRGQLREPLSEGVEGPYWLMGELLPVE